MALAININELIHGGVIEWERLEFKQGWNPEDVLHTLCAFANDLNNWGGGYIILGIAENKGRPVLPPEGLNPAQIDSIQGEITGLGHRLIPQYIPLIQPYLFQGKPILVLYAPAGDMRPYSAPENMSERGLQNRFSYIRSGSRTIKAQNENLRRLQELTARIPFDDRICQTANQNDLSLGLIRDFLHEIKSDLAEESTRMPFTDLCKQMNIVKGPEELLRPVNAGLLFFSPEPHRFFERAWIEVVVRKDEAGKDFDEKYFKGPLHIQLRNALDYIRTNIIIERIKKVSGRAESQRVYNFPYDAVEEALSNAVFHKSYEMGQPIEVQIWADKIEILSFPGPVPPVNAKILAENKRIVARDYRNRRVGDFLKELHLTEGRGTGIPTIYKTMQNNGSPPPIFETDVDCTYFLTVIPAHSQFIQKGYDPVRDQDDDYVNDAEQIYNYDYVARVLKFAQTPKSKTEILTLLGYKNHFDNYRRYIAPLIDNHWLEMTIPHKPSSRNQKYRTTALGKKFVF
ncbi:MAG: ATP-binding protein [Bacteroidia bacterium]|nr:ATP-binding protein [Bacteroidia bacterium]